MYKPTLKRTTFIKETQPTLNSTDLPSRIRYQPKKPAFHSHVMVPSKMLETPQQNSKAKSHLVAPLFIKSHKYPKRVIQQLETEVPGESSRGVGGYRQINWLFQGKSLVLWITDKQHEVEIALDEEITAVAMGQLKAQYLPSKIKNKYLIAVGALNTISLYCLNNFTLQAYPAGVRYTIRHSLSVQDIKFIEQNKILIGSNTGMIELVEFGQAQSIKRIEVPFYRRIVPVSAQESTFKIQQMVYAKSKIFVLMTQIRPKFWLVNVVENFFSDAPEPYLKTRFIQVFEVGSSIVKKQRIQEKELEKKIRNYIPGWRREIEIKSIYVDRQNDRDGQLGIVTQCGCFLTLRNNYSLSREPLFVLDLAQLQECRFLTQKTLEPVSFANQQTKNYHRRVFSSLGYENLTLLEDSLLWIGEERIDGAISTQLLGEIYEKYSNAGSGLFERNRQWGLFGFSNYYTVRQLPIRQLIATLFYLKSSLSNEYEGFHYKEPRFNSLLERYVTMLGPEVFLRNLIEIVISQERFITVNPFFIGLIEGELKDEKAKDMKDWKHELAPTVKTKEIFINDSILQHIWSMILELQSRQLSTHPSKFVNLYESNVYWLTMHSFYHSLLSPLYPLNPEQFRDNRALVEDVTRTIKSIQSFFEKKQSFERWIRQSFVSKTDKKDVFSSLDNTSSSFSTEQEVGWIPEPIRRSIASRAINENYRILQGKIQLAFKATAVLLTIYSNLDDYSWGKQGLEAVWRAKTSGTTFKQVLASKQLQKFLKQIIISKLEYNDLLELDQNLPAFNLEPDLRYLRCINKIKLQKLGLDQLSLQEIAEAITSDYFEQIDSVFGKRYDLKLKMLGLYQERLIREKEGIVKSNTLQERSIINRTFFPEDQEENLKFKRSFLDRELDLVLEEQKKCIIAAVHAHAEAKITNLHSLAPVVDQIIIHVSDKSYLLQQTEEELRKASLIRELSQLQRIKPRSMSSGQFSSLVKVKPQYLRRDLFPAPKPY